MEVEARRAEPLPTERTFAEFRDHGLLWLINASAFHPRGYAIGFVIDETTGAATGWRLYGDGTEHWQFGCDDKTQTEIKSLFAKLNELMP